jgi:glycosyltransferase involved in cell wall biosynthesis
MVVHLTTVPLSLEKLLIAELHEAERLGIDIVGMSAPGTEVRALDAAGINHIAIDALSRSWAVKQDLAAFAQLWRTFRRLQPDVVHTHNPKTGVLGRIAARLAGVPVVVNTVHGLWATPDAPRLKRIAVLSIEAFAALFSDAELYQNTEDAAALRRWVGKRKQTVAGNGTDLGRFDFDKSRRVQLRAEWGIGGDELAVVGVGRQVAEKGIDEFCSAVGALRNLGRNVKGIWVGPVDDSRATWRPSATQRAAVSFPGLIDDMVAVYSAADIFVLPSHREGFPRSAMEAAACGRPVVLTDIRGSREVGAADVHVVFVPPRDPAALTAGIDRYVVDASLRERHASALNARAMAMFDQRRIARLSVATYRDAAHRRRISTQRTSWLADQLPTIVVEPYQPPD